MIHYRKIMELADDEVSLRAILAITGNGRPKVTEILQLAKEKGLTCALSEERDNQWIEEFLYPHLLHHEYQVNFRTNGKIPYYYRSFLRHYKYYVGKCKATLRI